MKIITAFFLIMLLSACALFNPEKKPESKAKTIASAAGFRFIDARRDKVINNIDIDTLTIMNYGASLEGAYIRPIMTINNSIFGWMPKELASNNYEARDKISSIIFQSAKNALKEQGLNFKEYHLDEKYEIALAIKKDDWGCQYKDGSWCYLFISIPQLSYDKNPHILGDKKGWELLHHKLWENADNINSIVVKNEPNIKHFDLDILLSLSNHLPEWAYLYLAPNGIKLTDGSNLEFPLMLEQGKPLMFLAATKQESKPPK